MHKGQEDEQDRKHGGCHEQNAPRSHQTSEIDDEWTNKHQAHVKGGANPCGLVKAESLMSAVIGEAERNHAARQCYCPRADQNAEDPEQRALRQFGRDYRSSKLCLLVRRRCWDCGSWTRHRIPCLVLRADGCGYRKPWLQAAHQLRALEGDLHGYALHDFGEVAGRIVRG